MNNTLVSIIVPIYNYKSYLRKCIDSLLKQNYENIEIILVDDGSSDGSAEICRDYAEKSNKIVLLTQENKGVTAARLAGLERAAGEYVTFVDADDWIEDNHIEILISQMTDRCDLVACGAIREDSGTEPWFEKNRIKPGFYSTDREKKFLYERMLCSGYPFDFGITPYLWNKLYRKELLQEVFRGINKEIYIGEDVVINCIYCLSSRGILLSDECTYHYIGHLDSQKFQRKKDYFLNASSLYIDLYKAFVENENSETLLFQLDQYMRSIIWNNSKDGSAIYSHTFFPFRKVERDKKIILYGAGKTGRIFYEQIGTTKYCNIVAWVAGNAKEIQSIRNGIMIEEPEKIAGYEFDFVVIASYEANTIQEITETLRELGVEKEKIIVP